MLRTADATGRAGSLAGCDHERGFAREVHSDAMMSADEMDAWAQTPAATTAEISPMAVLMHDSSFRTNMPQRQAANLAAAMLIKMPSLNQGSI
ncbi:MAG: hypothetical protein FJ224_05655 [Lentisphaerae bacterium]|nr:hypothetical protein [Lentisphaerota bacterium]